MSYYFLFYIESAMLLNTKWIYQLPVRPLTFFPTMLLFLVLHEENSDKIKVRIISYVLLVFVVELFAYLFHESRLRIMANQIQIKHKETFTRTAFNTIDQPFVVFGKDTKTGIKVYNTAFESEFEMQVDTRKLHKKIFKSV